jgi:hypothetical protein
MNDIKQDLPPCPKCGGPVRIEGNECYPSDGMIIKCENLDCDWYGPEIVWPFRSNKLSAALVAAWRVLA